MVLTKLDEPSWTKRGRGGNWSPCDGVKVSKLQMKGIMTLILFLIATETSRIGDGIVFCSAAEIHDTFSRRGVPTTTPTTKSTMTTRSSWMDPDGQQHCTTTITTTDGTNSVLCTDILLKQESDHLLSSHCANCLEACQITRIVRGGHQSPTTGAAAAATAVTAIPPPFGIPLNVWKVLLQAFLTALNVLCWFVPLQSKRIFQNDLALSLANAFSGGIFLTLAFCHMIPECTHGFQGWPEATPYGLVLLGYLIIFFVEKMAFGDAHELLHEMQSSSTSTTTTSTTTTTTKNPLTQNNNNNNDISHKHPASNKVDSSLTVSSVSSSSSSHSKSTDKARNGDSSHVHYVATTSSPEKIVISSDPNPSSSSSVTGSRSGMILLAALGVHSVLEMMALGLSDSFGDAALMTLSIALHQPAESIALLVALVKSGSSPTQIIQFLSIFSCMGPIGVALGMVINEYAAPIVDSILLAIVAGTFVYVGATEVIPEEFENHDHKWMKFAALMTGIVFIIGITQYTSTLEL